MKPVQQPIFLERRTYRRRRMRDAARLLPLLGLLLVMVPMLWSPEAGESRSTAADGIYLFVVWAVMVLVARVMVPGLDTPPADGPATEPRPGAPPTPRSGG